MCKVGPTRVDKPSLERPARKGLSNGLVATFMSQRAISRDTLTLVARRPPVVVTPGAPASSPPAATKLATGTPAIPTFAPVTFTTKADALACLSAAETDIHRGACTTPEAGKVTLSEYAQSWLVGRPDLRPSWAQANSRP